MKYLPALSILLTVALGPGVLQAQELPLQRFESSAPQIDLRVYVDIAVDFWIQGDRIRFDAGGTRAPRNDGSAYSAGLPYGPVSSLRVQKIDGRGDLVVLEQPTAENAWTLKLRISDPKGGEDRYHARITWDGGGSPRPSTPGGPGGHVEITEMSATAAGSGQFQVAGQRYNISETSVSLIPGGRAILSFTGQAQPRFTGTWSQSGSRIALNLDNALGAENSHVSGSLELSGDRLRRINLQGDAAGQGRVDLSFDQRGDYRDFTKPTGAATAPRAPSPAPIDRKAGGTPITSDKSGTAILSPDPPRAPTAPTGARTGTPRNVDSLSQRLSGSGYLESAGTAAGQDDVLTQAVIQLDRGGRARLELEGDLPWVLLGTWRQLSADRVEIEIEQLNSAPAGGRGTLSMQSAGRRAAAGVYQLELAVTASRVGALDIRFRPNQ